MKVDCPHWRACGVKGGGCCALGRGGGRPSFGVCAVCLGIGPPVPKIVTPRAATEGPKRWAELHRRARGWKPAGDVAAELAFIARLADGLGLCNCRRDWTELLKSTPPDLSTRAAYVAWASAAHDAVNIRLGRPKFH